MVINNKRAATLPLLQTANDMTLILMSTDGKNKQIIKHFEGSVTLTIYLF